MSHAVLDRQSSAGPLASPEFYFRHSGCIYGPYDRGTLRDVLVAAGIRSGLEIRSADERDWAKVPSVSRLLERIENGEPPGPEAPEPVRPNVQSMRSPSRPAVRPSIPANRATVSRATGRQVMQGSFFGSFARRETMVLAAILLIWLTFDVAVLGSYRGSGAAERNYSREILTVSDEFREFRRRSATEAEWSALQLRAGETLRPVIRDLEKSADPNRPARQHLLWAARDYLPMMLRDTQTEPSDSERFFDRHMEESRRLLAAER